MNVKKESKILLTALAVFPIILGIVLVASGESVLGGLLLFLLFLILVVLLWLPRNRSAKKK